MLETTSAVALMTPSCRSKVGFAEVVEGTLDLYLNALHVELTIDAKHSIPSRLNRRMDGRQGGATLRLLLRLGIEPRTCPGQRHSAVAKIDSTRDVLRSV
jgi:hypothetical protein